MQRAPSRTLMASGSDEPVSDSGSQGHSIFAALLLRGMQSQNAQFTADDLFVSIRKLVLARSGQSPQYSSLRNSIRPSANLDAGDFVFKPKGTEALSQKLKQPDQKGKDVTRGGQESDSVSLDRTSGRALSGPADDAKEADKLIDQHLDNDALPFAQRSCSGGSSDGCFELGYLYYRGVAVTEDLSKAVSLIADACDRESMLGCLINR